MESNPQIATRLEVKMLYILYEHLINLHDKNRHILEEILRSETIGIDELIDYSSRLAKENEDVDWLKDRQLFFRPYANLTADQAAELKRLAGEPGGIFENHALYRLIEV